MTKFSSQAGFSSLGVFIGILAMIILMNALGFFTPPKSEIGDKNTYQPDEMGQSSASTLQFTDIKFFTPTPSPTSIPTATPIPPTQGPTATPGPTAVPIPTATPGPPTATPIPQPPTATPTTGAQ